MEEIARREKLKSKLEDDKLLRSILDLSLNIPRPGKRKMWDGDENISNCLINNERYKALLAKNDNNCGANNRLFGKIWEEMESGVEVSIM